MSKMIGLLLLAGGVLLLLWGFDASGSLSSELSRFFKGTPTDQTIKLLAGGAIAALAGLALLLRSPKMSEGR